MRKMLAATLVVGLVAGLVGCVETVKKGGPAAKKVAIRVSAGSEKEYVDESGTKWMADQVFAPDKSWGAVGGMTVRRVNLKTIAGTKAPDVYLTERYSMTAYQFMVPNGKYTVRLHFAETFEGITKEGERIFTVKIQSKPVLTDFDVFKTAGGFAKPTVQTFKDVVVTDGKLVIDFVPKVQNPEINGIEILPQ